MKDLVLLNKLDAPLSASPDCNLVHNCVNYCVVSVRYRRTFCVMHGLRPLDISESIASPQKLIW